MKIVFVGNLGHGQTTQMRKNILEAMGHQVIAFNTEHLWTTQHSISRRLQQSTSFGPVVQKINEKILKICQKTKPDLVWAEKQEFVWSKTLIELSEMGIKTVHYTPDPYFSLGWKQTRLTKTTMPLYDVLITSKQYELANYRAINPNTIYAPLGFDPATHRPLNKLNTNEKIMFNSDVAFIGGWEPRREKYLSALVENCPCDLKIWGYGWDFLTDGKWTPKRSWAMKRNSGGQEYSLRYDAKLSKAIMGGEVYGDSYAKAVSNSKINIGFLRQICPDQHTTRSFEIPACGSLLLADRTDEHLEFFKEGVEAEFFSSKEEMLDKIKFYLKNETVRKTISHNGHQRCLSSEYSYESILKRIFSKLEFCNTINANCDT